MPPAGFEAEACGTKGQSASQLAIRPKSEWREFLFAIIECGTSELQYCFCHDHKLFYASKKKGELSCEASSAFNEGSFLCGKSFHEAFIRRKKGFAFRDFAPHEKSLRGRNVHALELLLWTVQNTLLNPRSINRLFQLKDAKNLLMNPQDFQSTPLLKVSTPKVQVALCRSIEQSCSSRSVLLDNLTPSFGRENVFHFSSRNYDPDKVSCQKTPDRCRMVSESDNEKLDPYLSKTHGLMNGRLLTFCGKTEGDE
ncbi:hypothetical protein CEXT_353611 [Caerostris extrusa]|uniref:Uncharacterized protein n=1 Tax=Caerostris extrusa TaxID=172846 RepID=A0AAV4QR98_CAEEX|nr:hypothetical protein CEXT_353611 [Caerostris extrusa]